MRKFNIILLCGMISFGAYSQKLSIENTYEFTSLKKDSYLGNVTYDPDDKTTTLSYVEKDAMRTVFTNYVFDDKLEFVREDQEKFNLMDVIRGDARQTEDGVYTDEQKTFQEKYPWFDYRGESYTSEMISVRRGGKGTLIAQRVEYTYTFNWTFGFYMRKMKMLEKQTIAGADNERIFLYDRVNNFEQKEVYLLIGLKPPKGDKTVKWQHAKKFQILKINSNFELEELEKIEFPFAMAISYLNVLTEDREPAFEGEGPTMDMSTGQLAVVFSPVKSMLGKKVMNPDPSDHTMVLINGDGSIANKISVKPPTSGWVIEDYVMSADGRDVYFFGPAKDGTYVNLLQPTISPLTGRSEVKDIKYKDFQVMKISNGKKEWISTTNLDEFSEKAVTPPSQKKSPEYRGKKI